MKAVDIPELVQLPWADGAGPTFINSIPTPSQIGITTGLASLTDGFPPVTFLDEGAGGQPPFGADFNGILNLISANTRWNNAGGTALYDSTFSTYVGGYPKGAILLSADMSGQWLSLVDDNVTNPDTGGAGWVSLASYGLYSLAATGGTVTLTAPQYAKGIIIVTGTLTSNLSIVFPAFAGKWLVVNRATLGSFSISAKTASGSPISIPSGPNQIYGDGVNVLSALQNLPSTVWIAPVDLHASINANGSWIALNLTAYITRPNPVGVLLSVGISSNSSCEIDTDASITPGTNPYILYLIQNVGGDNQVASSTLTAPLISGHLLNVKTTNFAQITAFKVVGFVY